MFRPTSLIVLITIGFATRVTAQERIVAEWLVRGPLPADTGRSGVLADYLGGETAMLPTPGDTAVGGVFARIAADSLGRVDLNTVAGPSDWSAAYVHTYVYAPSERPVILIMDSDDDLVAVLNGQRVWVHVVPRGVGLGRDSVRVRLARGWNSLFLKVRNRTGGFGALGKLAPAPGGGGVDDLRLALERPATMTGHNLPGSVVAVGPLRVVGTPRWRDGALHVSARIPITAWGPDTLRDVSVTVGQGRDTWLRRREGALAPGEPVTVDVETTFERARRSATGDAQLIGAVSWQGRSTSRTALPIDADPLLRLLESRVAVFDAVDTIPTPTVLTARLLVPAALTGRTVELFTPGLGPAGMVEINGEGRGLADPVVLCEPCRVGDTVVVAVRPDPSRPLWMMPYARVREAGYAAYADGYRYATALASIPTTLPPPDPDVWLAALGTPTEATLRTTYADGLRGAAAAIRSDTLLLVGNSHIDAAWLWRWQETLEVIRNTWRTSLKLAELFPGYVFTGSSAAYYDALDRLAPGLADSIVDAAAHGSWAPVGGWWVEADMNMPSGESLVRQGLYGQRYFQQRFGRRSTVAWTPDTFGYPWTVPQILAQSGFEFFVTQKIRWSDSTDFPYNAFFWEGLDGTRIFSYNPYGYTHNLNPAALVEQRVEDRERTGGHHQLVLYGVGDHGGGPTIAMLQQAEDLRRIPTFPVMRYSAPRPALLAVANGQPAAGFPVWRDELYLEYHRGTYTSQAAIKRRHRRGEALLQTAEALAAVDSASYPRGRMERAWRPVLFNQFHDILPGSSIDSVYPDAHAAYDSAWALVDSLTTAAFSHLRARMDTRGGRRLVVFNPLGWTRAGTALAVDPHGDTVRVWVRDVPSLGARAVDPGDGRERESAPEAGPAWIENAFLRMEFDTLNGTITRLYDKVTRREVLGPAGYANQLQILDDRPQQWDAWNVMPNPEVWPVEAVERSSGWADDQAAVFEVERTWGNSRFVQRLVLRRGEPFVEVENEVDWHERRKLLKVAFAFDVAADSATYEIPYGVIGRSGVPRTQAERAKFEVSGQRWADVSQSDYGVSILNDGKYGWDYRNGVLRLSLLKAPIWPDSTADRGRHTFRFAIYPHPGDWREAATVRRAAEYNVPLVAAMEPPHRGDLGREVSFASLDTPYAQLAWIKRAEDSEALVLRVVEWHGRGGPATIRMRCAVGSATRANLLEDAGPELAWDGNRVRFEVRPYEIATVMVRCE